MNTSRTSLASYFAGRTDVHRVKSVDSFIRVVFPEEFSFIEDPDGALRLIRRLLRVATANGPKTVTLDQSRCYLIDYCAESVMSVLALDARAKHQLRLRGFLPAKRLPQEIVMATGLPSHLGIEFPEVPGFFNFGLVEGRKVAESARTSSQRDHVTTRLVNYVDECLSHYELQLNPRGRMHLVSLVSEVIGNAEDHGERPEWWVAAYLREPVGNEYGDCHITLFNFGRTIYESLQTLPKDALLRLHIERLVSRHTRYRLFSPNWTPEMLWTLYALQEGVSCKNTSSGTIGDRGRGTADMIEFFQALGQSGVAGVTPKMCVVSGNTHIVFDDKLPMREQMTAAGEMRRIIAFNPQNDLERRPDPKNVRRMREFFPGTLISLRFYLNRRHLAKASSRYVYGDRLG